ncbi:hypothetical protein H5410_032471 [Solanum commersonii]|uniref:Uncharacterized protein n=1 Tax=Solanum commersonii TaxID=4109 RepID=A0A9J5YMA4_SOLCO|nr:hypothetical protein H5410_032471 [Solanum commersonii]
MSPDSRRVMQTVRLSNRNRRDLLHHLLVHLHLRTRVSTMGKMSELKPSYLQGSVAQEVVSLLPAPSVVGTTQVFVVRAPLVVSSVDRMDISCESVQKTGRPAIAATAKKPLKFYPADYIKKSFVNKHKSNPTKLILMISNLLSKLRRSRRRKKEEGEIFD